MTGTGLILTAALALAQPPVFPAVDAAAERAEDVEVMRRILNKAVGLQHDATSTAATRLGLSQSGGNLSYPSGWVDPSMGLPNNSPNSMTFSHPIGTRNTIRLADPFDGVYLKGHGVVYTLKVKAGEQYAVQELRRQTGLSAGCSVCHKAAPVPVEKLEPVARTKATATEWDRTRNALHGLKEESADPAPTVDPKDICRPGKLTEALMTTLMKNGRHIRHLSEAEAVTLVVTLDGLYGPARVAAGDPNQAVVDFLNSGTFNPTAPTANHQPAPAQPPETKSPWFTDDEAKQIALGDLHIKQGKPKEAAEAYTRALERLGFGVVKVPMSDKRDGTYMSGLKQGVMDVRKKLAQSLLAAGDLDGAKKALDAVISTQVYVGPDVSPPVSKPLPVPVKLVLTVKKTDLDRAEKFISAAEFRKLVAVETVGLPSADKAKK